MNIDRDDEYATRHEAAPTIEEQIEYMKRYWWQYKEGYEILASHYGYLVDEVRPRNDI